MTDSSLDALVMRQREEMGAAMKAQRATLNAEQAAMLDELRRIRVTLDGELQAALDDLAREDEGRQSYTSWLVYILPADVTSLLDSAPANARRGTLSMAAFAVRGGTDDPDRSRAGLR